MGKTADAATSTYTWDMAEGLPLVLAETIGANTAYWVTGLGGLPLEEIAADGTVYYYHSDKLGSTRALSKDDGVVVATYDYDAYGNLTSQTGFLQPFQFAGQYSDAESGLQYLRARYYDPATEQFLTRDPLTPRTQLPYVYAQDSPPNRVDPSGLDSIVDPNSGDGGGPPSIGPAQEEAIAARIARTCANFFPRLFGQPEVKEPTPSTAHGAERAADPSRLSTTEQAEVMANYSRKMAQADGATVYIQDLGNGKFNVVVSGQRGPITNLKEIDQRALDNLARNYGWQ
jgi:RHS repeat-associated protein